MKLLVIGQSVIDHFDKGGRKSIQPGGMFYSAAAFSAIKNNSERIYLLSALDDESASLFNDVYNNFDLKYLQHVEKLPRVHLKISEDRERQEKYENLSQNLKLPEITFDQFDGIYINMVTGFDLTIDQIKNLRRLFKGKIYLDIHTLSRGLNKDGIRTFREIPYAGTWIACADIIQVNEHEIFTLSNAVSEVNAAENILSEGAELLIVTKAERGAKVYFKQNEETASVYHSAFKVNVKNKIGCGDVFGASFFYNYIEHRNIISALRFANLAAGFAASCEAPEDLKNLRQDVLSRYY